jgi:hypothetical protein
MIDADSVIADLGRAQRLFTARMGRDGAQPIKPMRCHSVDHTTGGNMRTRLEVDGPTAARSS